MMFSVVRRSARSSVLLAVVALVCVSSGRSQSQGLVADQYGAWTRVVEQAPFEPRDTVDEFVFNGRMWISDGYTGSDGPNGHFHDLWSSTDGRNWTLENGNIPYAPFSEMVVFRGKMWAIKDSVWNSSDGRTWTEVLSATPFGRRGSGEVVEFNGKLWQLGSGEDVWVSDDGVRWTYATPRAAYGVRYGAAVVVFNERLWVMGGWAERPNKPLETGYPDFTTFNDVWSSPDGETWTLATEHAPWQPRVWFPAKVYANRMVIAAGFNNVDRGNFNDVWFTDNGQHWQQLVSTATFSPRHEPVMLAYAGSLWLLAGNSWPLMGDVWRWTPWPHVLGPDRLSSRGH